MQNGRVRKVSIIFPLYKGKGKSSPTSTKSGNMTHISDEISQNSHERALAVNKPISLQPKIICQRFISKDSSINKQKKYSALSMFTQTNHKLYCIAGELESRVYMKVQDQDKLHIQERDTNGGGIWCPDIYCSDNDNQMF